jgi:hypothetical protein
LTSFVNIIANMFMTMIVFNEFHWEVEMMMTLGILRVEDIKIDSGIGTIVSQEPNDRLCRSSGKGASYQGSVHIDAQYTTYTGTVQGLCLNIFFKP